MDINVALILFGFLRIISAREGVVILDSPKYENPGPTTVATTPKTPNKDTSHDSLMVVDAAWEDRYKNFKLQMVIPPTCYTSGVYRTPEGEFVKIIKVANPLEWPPPFPSSSSNLPPFPYADVFLTRCSSPTTFEDGWICRMHPYLHSTPPYGGFNFPFIQNNNDKDEPWYVGMA